MGSIANTVTELGMLPPFPQDLPIAALSSISLLKLSHGDPAELARVLHSARTVGFFRVDLTDTATGRQFLASANKMFKLSEETFDLPGDVKLNDNILKNGDSMLGYKGLGASVIDKDGNRDNNEQYWIGCGDIFGVGHSRALYNDVIRAYNSELREFAAIGKQVTDDILGVFSSVLGISPESDQYLPKLHSHSQNSGSHVRLLKCPARASSKAASLQPHTDWGTFTVLFNTLGGLQLYLPEHLVPEGEEAGWKYVEPQAGTAIFNLGDAMVEWSAGEYKSNIHRVIASPGEQWNHDRYSLAYFVRPDNDIVLKPLGRKALAEDADKSYPTFKEWALRRYMAGRADNFKKGDWEKGSGTEGYIAKAARM